MSWTDTIQNKALGFGEYLRDGLHAMPANSPNPLKTIPSMHRLFNAMGMIAFWIVGSKITNLIFGMKPDGTEIKRDEVPAPFRFMHGIVKYNAYGDDPYDKWCKVTHQMAPAAFGAFGAIYGSKMFFVQNGRDAKFKAQMQKDKLNPLEADEAAAMNQALPMRILAGAFAIFGSVSALTPIYGFFLNPSFALASNRKMWAGAAEQFNANFLRAPTNTTSSIAFGPGIAINSVIAKFENYFRKAPTAGAEAAASELSNDLTSAIIKPLMPKLTKQHEESIVKGIREMVQESYAKAQAAGKPEEVAQKAAEELQQFFTEGKGKAASGHNFAWTLKNKLGIGDDVIQQMKPGNNGWYEKMAEWLGFKGKLEEVQKKLSNYTAPAERVWAKS